MIASCPGCRTRYRVSPEKIGPKGARIRCQKCSEIFRVDPPAAEQAVPAAAPVPKPKPRAAAPPPKPPPTPAPPPVVARALVVEVDADLAKALCSLLRRWGIEGEVISDGARALLEIHRRRPDLALLGARLPGMSAPAIAEVLRRNADLQEVPLVRFLCDEERATEPEFDADHTLDPGDLPEALAPVLEQIGVGQKPVAGAAARPPSAPASEPPAASAPAAAPRAPAIPAAPASGSDAPNIKAAERLARIVISDIILYNEEKFAEAASAGNAPEALTAELEEARAMFNERVSEDLRSQRDFLIEELQRRAEKKRARG